MKDKSCS